MSNIEPTEEQLRAAEVFTLARLHHDDDDIPHLARLLAEREAKLREDIDANIRLRVAAEDRTRLLQGLANTARAEADTLQARLREWRGLVDMHMNDANTLRARVAELDGIVARCTAQMTGDRQYIKSQDREIMRLEVEQKAASEREAQHLADIRAAKDALRGFLVPAAHTFTFDPGGRARDLLARLAHYDAKDAEGGEG